MRGLLIALWFVVFVVLCNQAIAQQYGPGPPPFSSANLSANPVTAAGGATNTLANWLATSAPPTIAPVISLTDIGNTSGGPVTSLTVTTTAGVPVGSLIIAAVADRSTGALGSGVTDTAGDTFTLATSCHPNGSSGQGTVALYYAINANGMAAGATVTYTSGGSNFLSLDVSTSLGPSGTVDASICGTGTGTSAASGSLTPNVAGDLFVGFTYSAIFPTTYTQGAGFAAPPNESSSDNTFGGFVYEPGIAAHNYAPTTVSQQYATALVAFSPLPKVKIPCAPTPAAAAGYCTNTFSTNQSFSTANVDMAKTNATGYQWYSLGCFGLPGTTANVVINSNGTIQVGQGGNTFAGNLATATCTGGSNYIGTAFGGGAYIEGVFKFTAATLATTNGWPSFWTNTLEGNLQNSQWTGQAAGYLHYFEGDIFEYFEGGFSSSLNTYQATIHDWYGISSAGDYSVFDTLTTTQPNYSLYHKYGMLWIPATASKAGSISFYFDGLQVGAPGAFSYTQFTTQSPPPSISTPWAFGIVDQQHLVIEMGSNNTYPLTVQSVNVWQANAASNLHQ